MFEAAVHVPAVLRLWRAVICYAMLCVLRCGVCRQLAQCIAG